jgi:molecular chaperone GrpE
MLRQEAGEQEAGEQEAEQEERPAAGEAAEQGAAEAAEQGAAEAAALQQRAEELASQLDETRNRYLRALADLDNTRKRARHEMAEGQVQAAARVLVDVVSVVDSFERALETATPESKASPETKAVYEGMSLIYRQLVEMLARRGVKPIEALGQPFDPKFHEAVAQVPVEGQESDGLIGLEMQKGYLFGERVLRASKVGVNMYQARGEQGESGGN